jgi:spore germination cell wall hydrolase CwlJ-like protein
MRSKFATLYLACAAIAALFTANNASAHRATHEEPKTSLTDPIHRDRDIAAESDLYCLALAVYFEGGSSEESEEGQRHIAHVVVARANANRRIWGGSNICDVVFHKAGKVCQFSFACLPLAQRTARGGRAWSYSVRIAREELEGRSGLEERSLRYYMNASLTPPKNACRFRKEFVPVIQAGRHEFFREATRAERRLLEKAEHEECRKYEASLKKKKHAKKGKDGKGVKLAKNDKKSKDGSLKVAKKAPPKKVTVAKR